MSEVEHAHAFHPLHQPAQGVELSITVSLYYTEGLHLLYLQYCSSSSNQTRHRKIDGEIPSIGTSNAPVCVSVIIIWTI